MPDEANEEGLKTKPDGGMPRIEEVEDRCAYIIANVNKFKQPRIERLRLYRDLYAGKVKPKYRQPFNVVLPVFAGAIDTLLAGFNDDLAIELSEQEPSDYLKVPKFQALWDMEVASTAKTAKFPLKTRWDRSNAMFSGRGFMMSWAASDPKYKNHFEIFELEDAIFQPQGGGHLEDHLYKGRDNLVRSKTDLLRTKGYDQAKVAELLKHAAKTDIYPSDDEDMRKGLTKYQAMGLSPQNADYVGEQLFKLVELVIRINGADYYVVFSPWYKKAVRFQRLKDVTSAVRSPVVSWATHEDNKNFLSKSFADDLYGVADAVHTMFNQELYNREKRNFSARGYDPKMFRDAAKLDQAQTRPDALVAVHVPEGKRVADGIFTFETPELRGTIDLINWMNETTGRNIGVTDLSQGGVQQVSKKATVVFAEQQNINKRLLLRSSPYTEAMGEIVHLFIAGAVDHLPAERAVRVLGPMGQAWDQITRDDLDLKGDLDIRIVSSSVEMRNSQLKKEARLASMDKIASNPYLQPHVNAQAIAEEMLRSGAELDEFQIAVLMDTKNYGNKHEVARAYKAIQDILQGRKVELYYGACNLFLEIILNYANEHRDQMSDELFLKLMDYMQAHANIAAENAARKARATVRQAQAGALSATPEALPGASEDAPALPSVSEMTATV